MNNFFVISNSVKDKDNKIANVITSYLTKKGAVVSSTDKRGSQIPADTECVIVIGGDGTIVQTAEATVGRNIPILGVNAGKLGFLAACEPDNIENSLDRLLNGKFDIEQRMMIEGSVVRDGKIVHKNFALNDVVITRSQSMQILHYHLFVNGQLLNRYDADGIIVGTPTGSTGYSLSAGGPIIEPTAELLLLTPICPHTLNSRSIIFSSDDEVVIEMRTGYKDNDTHAEVNFDGAVRVSLEMGDRIVVKKASAQTSLITFSEMNFLETVHKKMAFS